MSQKKQIKIGILGGGQLARMLCLKGHELGLEMHVLSEQRDDPAAQVCALHTLGSINSSKDIELFSRKVDILTFESEFINTDFIKNVRNPIFPTLHNMKMLQDRLSQKEALMTAKIPMASHLSTNDIEALKIFHKKNKRIVIKKRRGGYDGKGTYIIQSTKDLKKFTDLYSDHLTDFIFEEFIPFKRELALIMARSRSQDIVTYPLAESRQIQSRCDWICGPVTHKKMNPLIKKLKSFLEKINYYGTIGFELFDVGDKILVNELAPRVHNSGHYSQNALNLDQFSAHLKALCGEKLYEPQLLSPQFCMINLIGIHNGSSIAPTNIQGQLHWYGKKSSHVGRKMGHINYTGTNYRQLLQRGLNERTQWEQVCKTKKK